MKKKYQIFFLDRYQQGGALLEALVAILIFSIGILGVVGLQAKMVKGAAEARYRAEAGYLAQQRIGTLWVDQTHLADYAEENTNIAPSTGISGLPNGKRTTIRANADDPTCKDDLTCFTVIVSWQQPGGDSHKVTVVSRVTGE